MVRSVVDHIQWINQLGCHCENACNPTHWAHSPRRRQESSPTGVEHVVNSWRTWPPSHTRRSTWTLCINVFSVRLHQEYHAHASRWVRWRSHSNALRCNGGKSLLQQDVTMGCMHTIRDNQAWHHRTTFTITSMSNNLSHQNGPSVSDVLHGLLKPFCLTWLHVHCNVTSCQVEVRVSIVGCDTWWEVSEMILACNLQLPKIDPWNEGCLYMLP